MPLGPTRSLVSNSAGPSAKSGSLDQHSVLTGIPSLELSGLSRSLSSESVGFLCLIHLVILDS